MEHPPPSFPPRKQTIAWSSETGLKFFGKHIPKNKSCGRWMCRGERLRYSSLVVNCHKKQTPLFPEEEEEDSIPVRFLHYTCLKYLVLSSLHSGQVNSYSNLLQRWRIFIWCTNSVALARTHKRTPCSDGWACRKPDRRRRMHRVIFWVWTQDI